MKQLHIKEDISEEVTAKNKRAGHAENLQEGLNGQGNKDHGSRAESVAAPVCREQNWATETRTKWARNAGLAGCDRKCGSYSKFTMNHRLVLLRSDIPRLTFYKEIILALPREHTGPERGAGGPLVLSTSGTWLLQLSRQQMTGDWTR